MSEWLSGSLPYVGFMSTIFILKRSSSPYVKDLADRLEAENLEAEVDQVGVEKQDV